MRLTSTKILLVLAVMLTPPACGVSDSQLKSRDTKEIGDNVYYNSHFGLSVQKPESWYALDNSESTARREAGSQLLFDDDREMKRASKISEKRTTTLFSFSQHAPGAPVEFNPAVIGLSEDISHAPGVKSGKDYFYHMKKLLRNSDVRYEFAENYTEYTIDGVTFDRLDLSINFAGTTVAQSYYAARHDDTMIVLIESYGTEQMQLETTAILDTIELDWDH